MRCINGAYVGKFEGCSQACTLPAKFCTPGVGLSAAYNVHVPSVATQFGQRVVDRDTCEITAADERANVMMRCGAGYAFEGGSYKPATCVGGNLVGGWADEHPVCVEAKTDDLVRRCNCGAMPTDVQVVGGKVSNRAKLATNGTWDCSYSQNTLFCACRCLNVNA